jgi:Protein of unknown function (DUF664)
MQRAGARAGRGHDGRVSIPVDTLPDFADQAVDKLTALVSELGDELANARPDLPGANSPYVILRHCLGVMEFWGGRMVAGRAVHRDRAAEFTASGPVAGLVTAAQRAKGQFRADARSADPAAPPRGERPERDADWLEMRSQGHALLHVIEELYQHLGQAELTRDLLLAGRR